MEGINHIYSIDLGTSNSVICHYNDGAFNAVMINGVETQPSVVCYISETEYCCGHDAFNMMSTHSKSTVMYNKKFKQRVNAEQRRLLSDLPYDHELDENGFVVYLLVLPNGTILRKRPVDVDVDYMRWLIKGAEEVVNAECHYLALTYPTAFTSEQLNLTYGAMSMIRPTIAPLRFIQEPVGAVLANLTPQIDERFFIVFDFGGGTFDVAVLRCLHADCQVIYSSGVSDLGGYNLTRKLTDCIISQLPLTQSLSNEEYSQLYQLCEQAKKDLSSRRLVDIHVQIKDIDNNIRVTREMFNEIIKQFIDETFLRLRETVQYTVNHGYRLTKNNTEVILVGGSSNIPCIKKRLESELHVKVNNTVNVNRVVSQGCLRSAIQQYCKNMNIPVPPSVGSFQVHLIALRDIGYTLNQFDRTGNTIQTVIRKGQPNSEVNVQFERRFFTSKVYIYSRSKEDHPWEYQSFINLGIFNNVSEFSLKFNEDGQLCYSYLSNNIRNEGVIAFENNGDMNDEMVRKHYLIQNCTQELRYYLQRYQGSPNGVAMSDYITTVLNNFFENGEAYDCSYQQIYDYYPQVIAHIKLLLQQP